MTFPQTSTIVWQSVEKPPEEVHQVLIAVSLRNVRVNQSVQGFYNNLSWFANGIGHLDSDEVKAWAEMPQLPE